MKLDINKFFAYLDDCNKTMPPNPEYDAIIKKLINGDSVEIMENGVTKYMLEDHGKIVFLTKTFHA